MKWGDRKKFNPKHEYGLSLPLLKGADYAELSDIVLAILHKEAKRILPKGTPYELRGKVPAKPRYDKGVAWYFHPRFLTKEYKHDKPKNLPCFDQFAGVIVIGRFTA